MSESKMTPGPWRWFSAIHTGGRPVVLGADGHRITQIEMRADLSADANARAIAALPELVEAARNVLELDRDTFPNYVRGTFAELRRILARIDGEDA